MLRAGNTLDGYVEFRAGQTEFTWPGQPAILGIRDLEVGTPWEAPRLIICDTHVPTDPSRWSGPLSKGFNSAGVFNHICTSRCHWVILTHIGNIAIRQREFLRPIECLCGAIDGLGTFSLTAAH